MTAWIYGPQRGTLAATALTGGGTVIYQPNYVRNQCNLPGSTFTGTIIFEQIQNTSGGNLPLNSAQGFPSAAVILGITNRSTVDICGTIAGNVLPFGSLSGGDNTVQLCGGTTPGSEGSANTIYAIGGLISNTVVGCQFIDGGVSIRKVGLGTLTLTNNVLSYGGQTVVSNGTLAFVPLGNYLVVVPSVSTNPAFTALTNNYLVGTNFTIVSPGILDMSAAGNTLYLGHNGAQTLFGNGTLNGSLVVSNSLIAPARRASDPTNYTGSGLTVNNSVKLGFGSSVLLTINRTNSPANDSLTAASIIYGGALVVTNLGDTAYANGSSNVFRLFKITGNNISGSFTNITLPALPAYEYWKTNLSLDGSIALVNTNSAINTNPPPIQISVNGTQLTLGWPTNLGWILQTQTNTLAVGLTTPTNTWIDVANSATQTNAVITITRTNPAVFYRLRLP
jgi:autotransporter-associated beta strand protein